MKIILPQNPIFYETLENIDLYWAFHKHDNSAINIVVDTQSGLLKNVDDKGFQEYVFGGELDEQLMLLDDETLIQEEMQGMCGYL